MKVVIPEQYAERVALRGSFSDFGADVIYYEFQRSGYGLSRRILAKLGMAISNPPSLVFSGDVAFDGLKDVEGAVINWGTQSDELDLLFDRMPNIRWLHTMSSGVDHLPLFDIFGRGVALTSCKGLRTQAVSEYAMGLIYLGAKRFLLHHKTGRTIVARSKVIGRATLCVLGTGSIGQSLAILARQNGMQVVGVNRSGRNVEHFDRVHAVPQLQKALEEADFVAVCLPLTDQTRGLLDTEKLMAVKKGAYLVNLGRQDIIDSVALAEAVRSRHLSGAALDIDPSEPGHPCLNVDGVLFTNHSAFSVDDDEDQMFGRLVENVTRFANGKALEGKIQPDTGY